MEIKITNCKRGIMGTVEFDGQFPGMRKSQEFIVYPMQNSGEEISVQSDHRWVQINLATGKGVISANRASYANRPWLLFCVATGTAVAFQLEAEELQTLRQWVKSTGGIEVGSSIVKSDNTGALAL